MAGSGVAEVAIDGAHFCCKARMFARYVAVVAVAVVERTTWKMQLLRGSQGRFFQCR